MPCTVDVAVKTHVKLQVDKEITCLLRVDVKLQDTCTWIIVNEELTWPISIKNNSSYDILYHQHDCSHEYSVASGNTSNYSWDEPSRKDRRLIILCYGRRRELNLNQIGRYRPMGFKTPDGEKGHITFDVMVEGPVRVVNITDFVRKRTTSQQSKSQQRREREVLRESMLNASEKDEDFDDVEGKKTLEDEVQSQIVLSSFAFRLPGIGVSFVNRRPQEILYLFARDVETRYTLTEQHYTYGVSINWLQVDNQSFDWQYPIVLYPAMVRKSADIDHPFLRAALIQNRDDTHGLTHIVYAGLLLQEVNVELGDDVVRKILDFARFETVHQPDPSLFYPHELTGPILNSSDDDSSLTYFENLQIHPILINLTFTRTEIADDTTQTGYNPLATVINILTVTLGSITDAPLKFNLLLQEHGILSPSTLLQLIYSHYTSQAIGQLHKIVGAADFIGNPVGLFNSFSSGVHDLFYEPYQGFVSDRPQDFGIGLAKGGISLIRKTVYGLTDTVSKVTDTMGKGFSSLTFDPEFQNKRRLTQARNRPKHALHGLGYGAKLFIEGVSGGITGIVEKPIEGAQKEGIKGLFKGIGKGVIGAFAKTATGVIDLTTTTIQGIRNSADMDDRDISQIRPPRVIPYDGIVSLYSEREAQGQLMLSQILGSTLFHEFYVAHLDLLDSDPPSVLFLTTNRIILARSHSSRLSWQVPFSELTYCRPSSTGIQIACRTVEPRLRTLPIPDSNIQKWWCRKVDEAVAIYNESHRPLD